MNNRPENHSTTIFVVADDVQVREQAVGYLRDSQFTVREASLDYEALAALFNTAPDIILIDMVQSDLLGCVFCDFVRKSVLLENTPILALTDRNDETAIVRAYEAGASDFAIKPFTRIGLVERVKAILRAHVNQNRMYQLAYYDSLTSLHNRESFKSYLEQAVALAQRYSLQFAVLYLDLDDFKRINDTLGHDIGDLLLVEVAKQLSASLRDSDLIGSRRSNSHNAKTVAARVGGDEFVILLSGLTSKRGAAAVAQRIIERLSQTFILGGYEINSTPSIGIAVFPHDATDGATLLKRADAAMYVAKKSGKRGFYFYDSSDNGASRFKLTIDNELRKALDRDEFEILYQPQFSAVTGGVTGFEALLNWNNRKLGVVSRSDFVPVAEENGIIVQIGEWMLRTVCQQLKQWQEADQFHGGVSFNVSEIQFAQHGFIDLVHSIVETAGINPHTLEFEIAEKILAGVLLDPIDSLYSLKELGVRLAIDDYGTGHSSLGYLKRYPIDRLKIDPSYVRGLPYNPDDAAITGAVISMAKSMSMEVIAEGVETRGQMNYLLQQGCRDMQGSYVSQPIKPQKVPQWLGESAGLLNLIAPVKNAGRSVLFLDDDELILDAIECVLEEENMCIYKTVDPIEAFRMLALHDIQVVVVDYQMPTMKGTEFLRRMRRLYPDTVRIMLSGEGDKQTVINAVNSGAIYQFLEKPIQWIKLVEVLNQGIALASNSQAA